MGGLGFRVSGFRSNVEGLWGVCSKHMGPSSTSCKDLLYEYRATQEDPLMATHGSIPKVVVECDVAKLQNADKLLLDCCELGNIQWLQGKVASYRVPLDINNLMRTNDCCGRQ